jgi:CheY-like chemotaxis protein
MSIFAAAAALFGRGELQDAEGQSKAPRPVDTTKSKPTILVIDDDPGFLDAMRMVLRSEGYSVLAASTGPKGLDMVRYVGDDIRAVLLDFNMPRFNGAETLQFLRKLNPDLKVLAVSGVRLDQLPSEFREQADRFLPKPFSDSDLLKTLEEVLPRDPAAEPPASSAA